MDEEGVDVARERLTEVARQKLRRAIAGFMVSRDGGQLLCDWLAEALRALAGLGAKVPAELLDELDELGGDGSRDLWTEEEYGRGLMAIGASWLLLNVPDAEVPGADGRASERAAAIELEDPAGAIAIAVHPGPDRSWPWIADVPAFPRCRGEGVDAQHAAREAKVAAIEALGRVMQEALYGTPMEAKRGAMLLVLLWAGLSDLMRAVQMGRQPAEVERLFAVSIEAESKAP